ncbi:MAG: hypothetical protein WAT19_11430 [Ferruginibacter sp.]
MNKLNVIIILLCLGLFACKNNQRQHQAEPQPETPKALQDNSYPVTEIISKSRGAEDLLEELYNEEVSNSPQLKELDKAVAEIPRGNGDVAEPFNSYNNKNENFYNSGKDHHLTQIKDSALKQKMQAIINASLDKYILQVKRHKDIINEISSKTATMNDLYAAMKIAVTIPVIEKYQKQQLPSTTPLNTQVKKIDRINHSLDSVFNKK